MISLKATNVRKYSLIVCLLVVLACGFVGTQANAQGDDLPNPIGSSPGFAGEAVEV
jgi:hypothetical protein